jgi:hypothetical protein
MGLFTFSVSLSWRGLHETLSVPLCNIAVIHFTEVTLKIPTRESLQGRISLRITTEQIMHFAFSFPLCHCLIFFSLYILVPLYCNIQRFDDPQLGPR